MSTAIIATKADREDLLRSIDYATDFFHTWSKEGRLSREELQNLSEYYHLQHARIEAGSPPTEEMTLRGRDACWSCRRPVNPDAGSHCPDCGAPVGGDGVQRLRYLIFLCFEIKKHERAGRLNLSTAHDLLAEANDRVAAMRRRLEKDRAPLAQAITQPPAEPPPRAAADLVTPLPPPEEPARPRRSRRAEHAEPVAPIDAGPPAPRRSVMEIVLDPRTIQWLLASGGALLVLGLVIWLAAEGLFENKLFVAVVLGVTNAAVLAGGWALISYTRHHLAGRALTLLACLVMPLNLWFYDAQGLITVAKDGHLWIPALVCCVVYAASARLLKDVMLVPVFVGGVVLTGLLLLADHMLNQFWQISAPATMLVLLGLAAIHAERAFPVGDGPFSRRRFGLAFFWSGHAVLAAGLLLLLGTQILGDWLYDLFQPLYAAIYQWIFPDLQVARPQIVTEPFGRWLALALVLAGTYAYVYSDLVVRRIGLYIYVAVFTLLWAEVLFINIVARETTTEVFILALALTGLLANYLITQTGKKSSLLLRAGPPLALVLCGVPVLLGVVLHLRATPTFAATGWDYKPDLIYILAMAVTAFSCRVAAHLYRHENKVLSAAYFFGTAAATLVGAAGLLVVFGGGKMVWQHQAPLLMLIPILYLIASRLYRGHTAERPLGWVAHAATAALLLSGLGASFKGFVLLSGNELNLWLAAFFAEAAVFYAVAAVTRERAANVYLCTAAACAVVWQLFRYAQLPDEYYALAFAVVGLLLLVAYRFALLEKYGGALAAAAFQCGNALLSLAFAAGALIALSNLFIHVVEQGAFLTEKKLLILLLLTLSALSLVAVVLMRERNWRRWYVAAAVINAALTVLVLVTLGTLTPLQKLEIACVVIGVLLLGAGHFGWYREQDRQSDLVSVALAFGSLLVAVPLAATVLWCRWKRLPEDTLFHTLNEIGMLVLGLLLLATGFACQLRATTVSGAAMMLVYLLSLVLFLRLPEKLQTTAIYLMVGGAVFFGCGIVLSLYRDRLLTLPERVKRREGVFRVLSWR